MNSFSKISSWDDSRANESFEVKIYFDTLQFVKFAIKLIFKSVVFKKIEASLINIKIVNKLFFLFLGKTMTSNLKRHII